MASDRTGRAVCGGRVGSLLKIVVSLPRDVCFVTKLVDLFVELVDSSNGLEVVDKDNFRRRNHCEWNSGKCFT